MTDLYQYLTLQELEDRRPESAPTPTQEMLIQAQQMIDRAIPVFYEGINQRAYPRVNDYELAILTSNSVTLPISTSISNYYQLTSIRVLSGAFTGRLLFVQGSVDNVLTIDTSAGLTGLADVRVYQEAKFPRAVDESRRSNKVTRWIPEFLKDAVVLQYAYIEEGKVNNNDYKLNEYRVAQDTYGEKFDTSARNEAIDRLAPQVRDILDQVLTNTIR